MNLQYRGVIYPYHALRVQSSSTSQNLQFLGSSSVYTTANLNELAVDTSGLSYRSVVSTQKRQFLGKSYQGSTTEFIPVL
jgi:hypothetical protein